MRLLIPVPEPFQMQVVCSPVNCVDEPDSYSRRQTLVNAFASRSVVKISPSRSSSLIFSLKLST